MFLFFSYFLFFSNFSGQHWRTEMTPQWTEAYIEWTLASQQHQPHLVRQVRPAVAACTRETTTCAAQTRPPRQAMPLLHPCIMPTLVFLCMIPITHHYMTHILTVRPPDWDYSHRDRWEWSLSPLTLVTEARAFASFDPCVGLDFP